MSAAHHTCSPGCPVEDPELRGTLLTNAQSSARHSISNGNAILKTRRAPCTGPKHTFACALPDSPQQPRAPVGPAFISDLPWWRGINIPAFGAFNQKRARFIRGRFDIRIIHQRSHASADSAPVPDIPRRAGVSVPAMGAFQEISHSFPLCLLMTVILLIQYIDVYIRL
jgi:hypothetical protein